LLLLLLLLLCSRRADPIRIIGVPDNQLPEKCVLLYLCFCSHRPEEGHVGDLNMLVTTMQ